jgi:hypothetical protein
MRPFQLDPGLWAASLPPPAPSHHDHSERLSLSRRAFFGAAAGTTGAALAAQLIAPVSALADKPSDATPKPIPNGTTINGVTFRFQFFGPGLEPATITDFKGLVGVADVQGTGTATNPDGSTETLLFDTDMRFMKGTYVSVDGAVRKGTFGFV